jgi:uncharacterized integral membrane protein
MIPLFAVIGFRTSHQRTFRLWLPLFLIWLLLLPLVLVLFPFFLVGCLILDLNAFKAIAAGWSLMTGLRGTHVEVEDPKNYILLRLV